MTKARKRKKNLNPIKETQRREFLGIVTVTRKMFENVSDDKEVNERVFKSERNRENKHLKAYLKGNDTFVDGFITDITTGKRIQNILPVLKNNRIIK